MEIWKALTSCCDAVEAHKGVEAGGGTRQDSSQAERSKSAYAKLLINSESQKKRDTKFSYQKHVEL